MILNSRPSAVKFNYTSQLFDESTSLPGVLKNPNQFKEAVIYEHLSHLEPAKLKVFVNSAEAKAMVESGAITYDTLDRLAHHGKGKILKTAVCHVAKENNDELFDELIKLRAEERRVMNELIAKYRDEIGDVADKATDEIIRTCIPAQYR